MTFGPNVRYPAGTITTHGAYEILHDRVPQVALRAYDDSVVFNLMGGLAIPDRTAPERVELKSISGLVGPWKTIDQKGASQDGTTFVDALYDPIEIDLDVNCVGRDARHLRRVVSDLVASLDVKQESELSWFTHEAGRWWAPVRWAKPDMQAKVTGIANKSQRMTLQLRADSGFWQSYPAVDQFRFTYDSESDEFDYFTAEGDSVTGWTLAYDGSGSGSLYTDGNQAISSLVGGKTVVARRTSYTAAGDNLVVEVQLGTSAQSTWPTNTFVDLWARMNNTGTAGYSGIRLRLGRSSVVLSALVSGSETVLRQISVRYPFRPGERITLICGDETGSRVFKALRNHATMLTYKEVGTTSLAGSNYRKVGFGMAAASGSVRPPALRSWKAGVNATTAQQGYVEMINVGDQPMWPRFTCFGPGIFYIANGPGSSEFVKFGPLLPNQIMQIRTDPRKRGVVDMSSTPVSEQKRAEWLKAIKDYKSFLSVGGVVPNNSVFGLLTPQGNPYQLLAGRFNVPIPARSPGDAVKPYHIACKIDNGNADSQIIAAGTPYRRLPY